MIVEWMMDIGLFLFDAIYALAGVLPQMPSEVRHVVDAVFQIMFDGVSLASIFLDMDMAKILIPLAIAVQNFDWLMKSVMFILKKIPLLGIE